MQSSRNLRIRTSVTSPENPRQIKFLTPREKSKCFDFELGNINLIQSDPFNYLVKGTSGKLKPIALKTNKKCITRVSESASVCLKLPENSFAQMNEVANKSFLPSLFPDKLDFFRNLYKKAPKDLESFDEKMRKRQGGKGKEKKVTFVEEDLEFSFGNS